MGKVILALVAALFIWAAIGDDDKDEESRTSSATQQENKTPSPPPRPRSPWHVSDWTSPMDDSPAVALTANSQGIYTGAYGGPAGPATLHLRCLENSTNLFIKLNGHYLADLQSYGQVAYRIDGQQSRTMRMKESTDNKALGLWSGGAAIPVIRRMLGHEKVVMRITPFNESPVTVTFPIKGIEEKIEPLRAACHW